VLTYTQLFRTRLAGPADSNVVGRFQRVRFPFPDRVVDIAIAEDRVEGTVVAARCKELDGFYLRLRHGEQQLDEHQIGDEEFRNTYAIETSDLGLTVDLLDAETRSLIAFTGHALMPTRDRAHCYSYTIAQGFVSAWSPGMEERAESLEDTILAVDALARRPRAFADAWRRLAAALDAEIRGTTWTIGGDLRIVVPSPRGALTVAVATRAELGEPRLATRVIDDAGAVVWIEALVPDASRIRAAIARLSHGVSREPYR
jgi:hypothetical protein